METDGCLPGFPEMAPGNCSCPGHPTPLQQDRIRTPEPRQTQPNGRGGLWTIPRPAAAVCAAPSWPFSVGPEDPLLYRPPALQCGPILRKPWFIGPVNPLVIYFSGSTGLKGPINLRIYWCGQSSLFKNSYKHSGPLFLKSSGVWQPVKAKDRA